MIKLDLAGCQLEHDLAKVGVEGSNPFARSIVLGHGPRSGPLLAAMNRMGFTTATVDARFVIAARITYETEVNCDLDDN
jgi:hypothetical protein